MQLTDDPGTAIPKKFSLTLVCLSGQNQKWADNFSRGKEARDANLEIPSCRSSWMIGMWMLPARKLCKFLRSVFIFYVL